MRISDLFVKDINAQRGKLHIDSEPEKGEYQYLRPSLTVEDLSFGNTVFPIRKNLARGMKDDSVIALRRPVITHSLRSYEYAKHRPTLTVSEYQLKNLIKTVPKSPTKQTSNKGKVYTATHDEAVCQIAQTRLKSC